MALETTVPVKVTSRGVVFATVVLLSAAAMLATQWASRESILAGFALGIGTVAFFVCMRLFMLTRVSVASRLKVARIVGYPLIEGRVVDVHLMIENNTPIPIEHLEVYDDPPRFFDVVEQPRSVLTLPAYSKARISYRVKLAYGRHRWGPVKLVVYDPLGFFRAELTRAVETVVEVAPRELELVRGRYLIVSMPRPGGTASVRRKGVGTTIFSVREYVPGDETRLIDWKATARHLKLMVKEFEQEVVVRTLLVLDATPTMFSGVPGETKLEYAARILATVLRYVAYRGDLYRLVVIHPDGCLSATPWLKGRSSIALGYRALASVERVEDVKSVAANVERRIEVLKRLAALGGREKTLVVLVTDAFEQPEVAKAYADALARLKPLGYEVVVLLPLTAYFEVRALRDEITASFYSLLAYERMKEYVKMVREMLRHGVVAVATGPERLASLVLERIEALRRVM